MQLLETSSARKYEITDNYSEDLEGRKGRSSKTFVSTIPGEKLHQNTETQKKQF